MEKAAELAKMLKRLQKMIANANRSDNEAPDSEAPDSVVPDSVVPDNIVPANVPANMPAKVVPAEAVPARGAPVRVEFMSVVPCPKIHIGGGILVEEPTLRKLEKNGGGGGKFARALLRHLFTPEELRGKSLFGLNRGRITKGLPAKEALDPVRLRAILDYTCATFPEADLRNIKNTLSAFLARDMK
ncbi:hypothetical protein V5799_021275 [Amblyomma americanum]|uniref:BEN domain-containing protein n=1 Tax=Amblyomma americanum TaxID=6943 RepID=A0AAQ4FNN3_AMBAM